MPSPDQLHLPNPAGGQNGHGQQTDNTSNNNNGNNNSGTAVPSAPNSYYAFASPTASAAAAARHYARPPGTGPNGDWSSSSYATLRMPPPEQPFTDDMQDLQSRGKDPYQYTRRDEPYYEDRIASLRALESRGQSAAGAAPIHHLSPHYVRAPSPGPPQLRAEDAPLDDFANLERRRHATTVLDSPELLMMYAQSLNDSIPAVRMTFMRIMCGYDRDTMLSPTVVDAMGSSSSPYDNSGMGRRRQPSAAGSGGDGGGSSSSSRKKRQ